MPPRPSAPGAAVGPNQTAMVPHLPAKRRRNRTPRAPSRQSGWSQTHAFAQTCSSPTGRARTGTYQANRCRAVAWKQRSRGIFVRRVAVDGAPAHCRPGSSMASACPAPQGRSARPQALSAHRLRDRFQAATPNLAALRMRAAEGEGRIPQAIVGYAMQNIRCAVCATKSHNPKGVVIWSGVRHSFAAVRECDGRRG